jgi:lysophospholipase L1-like esterase
MRILPGKTTLTIVTFVVFLELLNVAPLLRNYKVLDWATVPAVLEFAPRKSSGTPAADEQLRLRPDTGLGSFGIYPIQDPSQNLDRFYEALARTERGEPGAVTRILHYGDSPATADQITADARALMQKRFGDAGHGFCLIAKPWGWYAHRGVEVRGEGWVIDPANQSSVHDGRFGLGGVTFRGGPGARSRIDLRDPTHSRVEIACLTRPDGGAFAVSVNGQELGVVETGAASVESTWTAFALPERTRQIEIKPVRGEVRLFGASFEKPAPGVVYHSLGVNGAYVSLLARIFDGRHWAAQLQHYQPDLVVVNYGTNESVFPAFVDHAFAKEIRAIVTRLREAVPTASILIMSPMDRGQRGPDGEIGSVPVMTRLVAIQEAVALDTGCAFFNTFQAMGGPGTMGKWYQAEPRLVGADFIHPLPAGAKIVGNLLYRAMINGYNKYQLRRVEEKSAKMGFRR